MRTILSFLVFLTATNASAFSVKIHIMYANLILLELDRDMNKELDLKSGNPRVRLLGQDGKMGKAVEIQRADAEAIVKYPEYWRGGAIGPDNTIFSGLTDPSHAWMFGPFNQCETLEKEARAANKGHELAYALGCFLHGVTDNVAHHLVNFFSRQTFTLTPLPEKESDPVDQSKLDNVVRHIVTESHIEEYIAKAYLTRPQNSSYTAFFQGKYLEHRVAKELYLRTYLKACGDYTRSEGTTCPANNLWQQFTKDVIPAKMKALQAVLYNGIDANLPQAERFRLSEERLVSGEYDEALINAYVEFLDKGYKAKNIHGTEEVRALAPGEYIFMMPAILADSLAMLRAIRDRGDKQYQKSLNEPWTEECDSVTKRLKNFRCRGEKFALAHLFAKGENGKSKFDELVIKKEEDFKNLGVAYLDTLENLSNLNTTVGLAKASSEQINNVLQPLRSKVKLMLSLPLEDLFPKTYKVITFLQPIRKALQAIQDRVKEAIINLIVDRLKDRLVEIFGLVKAATQIVADETIEELEATAAGKQLTEEARAMAEKVRAGIKAEVLAKIGMPGQDFLSIKNISTSVAHMNAFNTIVGVLANRKVIVSDNKGVRGPVSFDASFQLTYNQLSLCPQMRQAFYPCGISASEMMQSYKTCMPFPQAVRFDPPVECYDGKAHKFTSNPSVESCRPQSFTEVLDTKGHIRGSYTYAFPVKYVDPSIRPFCNTAIQLFDAK